MLQFARDTGIILAADVATLDDARRLAAICAQEEAVVAIKVGLSLALGHGLPEVVRAVRAFTAAPIIYDHQKAATDIPATGKLLARVCHEAGVDAVILFPQAGPASLEGFVTAVTEERMTPIVGLMMTHPAYLQSEGGYLADDSPEKIYQLARELGVTTFVLPGTKLSFVARFSKDLLGLAQATIMMPGIGSQGGDLRQALDAARPHRRYAIIGSHIYRAPNPAAALRKFALETLK